MVRSFVISALAVSVAAIAALVLGDALGFVDGPFTWFRQSPLPPDRYQQVGESETHNGITLTLTDAGFTSSETLLEFEIDSSDLTSGGFVTAVFIHEPSLEFTGVAAGRPVVETSRAEIGSNRFEARVRLGPADSPGDIKVVIQRLVLFVYLEGSRETLTVEGPWAFEFVAGSVAADPLDEDINLSLEKSRDGKTVKLDRLHLSTSGVQVYYNLQSTQAGFLGTAAGPPARIILPNGDWMPGQATQDDPKATGDLKVEFESLPPGTDEMTIIFGPFLKEVEGPFVLEIPTSAGARERVTVAGQAFDARIEEAPDGFQIVLTNVNDGPETVMYVPPHDPTAVDDLGNAYEFAGANWGGDEDEHGERTVTRGTFRFEGALDPGADSLTVNIPKMARLEYGPEFTVALPPEIGQ